MPFSRSRSPESIDAVGQLLVGAERAGLAQQGVDQGRLAVVDVGHDGHVPDVLAGLHGGTNDRGPGSAPSLRRPIGASVPAPASTSATASAPRVSTAGSGSTRTRWPESGHHPTTRPGTSSPRRRSASTRVTRASSARTEPRRGPDSTTRCALRRAHVGPPAERQQRRMGAVPPVVAADDRWRGERRPVEGAPQPGRPGHCFGADGGTPGRREAGDPAVELGGGGLPSRTQREDSASRARTASRGSGPRRRGAGAPRPGRWIVAPCGRTRRTARRRPDRRPRRVRAVRTSWSVTRKGRHRRAARPGRRASTLPPRAARQRAASTAGRAPPARP